ncbi:MAG: carboxylating nicotinate-nucleotide diphosphorylase [Sulfuriflexus sp.]|nr:carboxylating nicotinate-nucleotide diphosphorylase [Sulfuriflexus sp.]
MFELRLHTVVHDDIKHALAEDIGSGDITAALIPESHQSTATVISREAATISGTAWFDEVFNQLDSSIEIDWQVSDGDKVVADQILCSIKGPSRALLSGERTALNFLQTLSATASIASKYANLVAGTDTKILDTRKTIPGLRRAQKYAVTCGGCHNHRIGLYDAYLIKENHIAAAGSITKAVTTARSLNADAKIEVEVETMAEVKEALDAAADILLLDNFSLDMLREAVVLNDGHAILEASGNVTLDTVREIAETGVDTISTGELTKHVRAIDLSMRFQ